MDNNLKRLDTIENIVKEIVFPKFKQLDDNILNIADKQVGVEDLLPEIALNSNNIITLSATIATVEAKIDNIDLSNKAEVASIIIDYKLADNGIISSIDNIKQQIEILKQKKSIIQTIKATNDNTDILQEIQNLIDRVSFLEIKDDIEVDYNNIDKQILDLNSKINDIYNIDKIITDINAKKDIIEPTAIKGLVETIRRISMISMSTTGGNKTTFIPPQTSPQLSKTFTYNIDGTLNTSSDTGGTKTFAYINGLLSSIIGTNTYKNKTFVYNVEEQLINVNVT